MQEGQEVGYYDTDGVRHTATITDIDGKGPTHYKTLALTYRKDGQDVVLTKVPHEIDAEPGDAFWLPKGEKRKPVEVQDNEQHSLQFDVTDSAAALAEEHGVDLAQITGSGTDGRIIKSDVQEHIDLNP